MLVTINGKTMEMVVLADPATGSPAAGGGGGSGDPSDPAWDGQATDASTVAILKAIYAQNETIIGLLGDIKTNTTPA